ncbi:hypothetical protein Ngar_c32410 [Candidatus Nitrososphaera gargensis Ga9.2]|uniref:Uncharacterized protein n=1 Tax=Nitrososphaera gargensis (strain Ga9.2) TaxID=1237085 RepID=K0IMB4_NITGG|nr:hypothetical protein Ngar_c32410 [Candidatus Nitrososphaera gargensis Ga9.2]
MLPVLQAAAKEVGRKPIFTDGAQWYIMTHAGGSVYVIVIIIMSMVQN